jgi:hypothetical protein
MLVSKNPVSMFMGAPFRLNLVMSLKQYREITAVMRFTSVLPPMIEHMGLSIVFTRYII